jgi:hypothetical protein
MKRDSTASRAAGALLSAVLLAAGCGKSGDSTATAAVPPAAAAAGTMPVTRGPDGTLGVAKADGTPIDGVKLSQYDSAVSSPCVAVAPDGTVHVAFVEQQAAAPFTVSVYHRSSTDGGKTWSEPKNLSADAMPGFLVGNCKLLVDAAGRAYVLWRTGLREQFPAAPTDGGGGQNNIVYRVLDGGRWSKVLYAHKPGSPATQDDGSMGFVAVTDAAGRPQVVFNCLPNAFHPEQTMAVSGTYRQPLPGIRPGLIFQTTLDGAAPVQPREWFMATVAVSPADPTYGKSCDGFSGLVGYVDAAGQPHLLARVVDNDNFNDGSVDHLELIEGGKQTPVVKLAHTYKFDANPPRLLVDAKGARHVIALNEAGERPAVRDYTIGSDDDPAYVLAAKKPKGTIAGFQAFQGPGGKMAVLVQDTTEGFTDNGDTWLLTSDGGGNWSDPICLTNNAARVAWATKKTGALSDVSVGAHYGPGPGGLAFDKSGHVLIALVNNKVGSFALAAGGVVYAGGGTSTPMLFFYRL